MGIESFRPQQLHIPDGFLSVAIALVFWALTIVLVAVAIRRTQNEYSERQVPLMGVMAAFIFAAQMINFPVAGGTSGHLLGGALAAIALGPWAGVLVMTAVVSIQGLIFQDGGLLVMGANIFNMGILTAVLGYGVYLLGSKFPRARLVVAGIAAWLSVLAGALLTTLQLWLSGTTTLAFAAPAMLGVHALIGLGEALITVAALSFVFRTRPDMISTEENSKGWALSGMVAALLVVLVSPWASSSPDGLERVAIDLGFLEAGVAASYEILPDYTFPLLGESEFSTVLAGLFGLLILLAIAWGFKAARRKPTNF